ncbi:MAG: phosphatase PAP2 family protein [Reyranellaceae bacterium]
MLTRRLLVVLALLAALPVALPTAAREPPYLTAQDLDLALILPPPIVAGTEADREQQGVVIAAQRAASPDRIKQAEQDVDESLDTMFGGVLGKKLPAADLPATTRLFDRLGETEEVVVEPTKRAFTRVRPYLSNPAEIKALVRPSRTNSYPSGHTTRVNSAAIVLVALVPEKRDAIWLRVRDYAWSRVIGGMHYPNDLDGGARAGTAIAVAVMGRAEFKADFEAARRELRQHLGLQP